MPELPHPPRGGQASSPSTALRRLDALIDAARDLADAWHPALDHASYPGDLPAFGTFLHDLEAWRADVEAAAGGAPRSVVPVDLGDREAARAWLHALAEQIEDATAAGEDATRSPGQRELGRRAARAIVMDARDALREMVRAAEKGLGPAA